MLREEPPLEGHILLALLTDRVMHHLMEAIIAHTQPILHIKPILMAPLVLAEDFAWAEDSAEAEDLAGVEEWEEEGGKFDCIGISFLSPCRGGIYDVPQSGIR